MGILQLLPIVTHIHMGELMPDDDGEIGVAVRQPQDARLDHDLFVVGESVCRPADHQINWNGAGQDWLNDDRPVDAVATQHDHRRSLAVVLQESVDPARGLFRKHSFVVERQNLIAGFDAGFRCRRTFGDGNHRCLGAADVERLVRIRLEFARQAFYRARMHADLRRLGRAEVPIGDTNAKRDAVDPGGRVVIVADLRDLLGAMFGGDGGGGNFRQLGDRLGATRAKQRASNDGRKATPTHHKLPPRSKIAPTARRDQA
jgi:hypothetical protein